MSLLTFGSAAYDSLETPFGRRDHSLGGSGVYASFAASFFTRPRLVSVVGGDWNPEYTELLRGRGVDVEGLEVRPSAKTMFWRGVYPVDMNHCETLVTETNVLDGYVPVVPESYKDSSCVFLGNISPLVAAALLSEIDKPRLVVADTMNYYIATMRSELLELLRHIDGLILNEDEAKMLAETNFTLEAARKILKTGPRFVVVKRGEYGAFWMSDREFYATPSYPLETVVDPTGAGDAFAGAMMGVLAESGDESPASVKKALLYATVVSSLNIEGFSLERFRNVRREEIEERVAKFREMLV